MAKKYNSDTDVPFMSLFFTVITKSHLPYARLLHERLRLHEDDFEFLAFLIDGEDGCVDFKREAFPVVRAEDFLPAEQFRWMRFWYTANEFCNAAKAFAHQYILQHRSDPCWFYLDSDLYPVASLAPAFAALEGHDLLITPHCLDPIVSSEAMIGETSLLEMGVFNGGFLGLRRGLATERFVRWFADVLYAGCLDDRPNLFVDQKWLNLAPCLVERTHVWRHPGANVAFWNLHERPLCGTSPWLTILGQPLLFSHFSALQPENPEGVTAYNVKGRKAPPAWNELAHAYAQGIQRHGWSTARTWPYTYSHYPSGHPVPRAHRLACNRLHRATTARDADPFTRESVWAAAVRAERPPWWRERLTGLFARDPSDLA